MIDLSMLTSNAADLGIAPKGKITVPRLILTSSSDHYFIEDDVGIDSVDIRKWIEMKLCRDETCAFEVGCRLGVFFRSLHLRTSRDVTDISVSGVRSMENGYLNFTTLFTLYSYQSSYSQKS